MDNMAYLENKVRTINDIKRQNKIQSNKKYLSDVKKYIMDDHVSILSFAESILEDEDAKVSYNVSGPNIILSIEEEKNKITFNMNKVTKSYKINVSINSEEDEIENYSEYSYSRYIDGYYVTNVSKSYNNGEELISTLKKSYETDNEGNAELIDIYKYEKTDLYSWILQESMRDDRCIVTLLVLKDDYNIDTSIRGIKQDDCVNFYEGVCSGIVLSEDMYISTKELSKFIDSRVEELIEGTSSDIPMIFNKFKTIYYDYYNSDAKTKNTEQALEFYVNECFEFNEENAADIIENAHILRAYTNSFGEDMVTIEMKDGSIYTASNKQVPLFYVIAESQRIFYENENLQHTVLMSNYCNPSDINMYALKSYSYEKEVYNDKKVLQINQTDILEGKEIYILKESNRNISCNNPLSLRESVSYDCYARIDTDVYSTRFQSYYDDKCQKVFIYDFMPVPENLGGYKIILKEGVNDKGESNVELAIAFGSRYLEESEDEFKFNDIWDMKVRKIVDGREIYLDTLAENDNNDIKEETDLEKEKFEKNTITFPDAQDANEVTLFCPLLNTDDTACFCYATANDSEFSNIFNAINSFYKIAIGDNVEGISTVTYDRENDAIKIEEYNNMDDSTDIDDTCDM